jgi:hypothetical protein
MSSATASTATDSAASTATDSAASAASAAAAAASMIDVMVKTLSGDLIQLSVDSALGLKGVENALTLFDSDAYAPFQFRVFFADEEETELTQDTVLGVVAVIEPMAHLVEVVDSITLPGTNASYSATYKVFKFELSSPIYPVLYIYTYVSNGISNFYPSLTPLKNAGPSGYFTVHPTVIYNRLLQKPLFPIPDAHVVMKALEKMFPSAPTEKSWLRENAIYSENQVYCKCGCIVKKGSMISHLKTKLKHKNGDEKGKAFLARVAAHIESL